MSKVFISSTCYDFGDIRYQLNRFLLSRRLTPVMSENSDVFFRPDEHTHTSCVQAVTECNMLIFIVGGRFGGNAKLSSYNEIDSDYLSSILGDYFKDNYEKRNFSITQLEVLKAIEIGIPLFTYVEQNVDSCRFFYKKNKNNKEIDYKKITYPHIEKQEKADYIFEFIELIHGRNVGNSICTFSYVREIEDDLNK